MTAKISTKAVVVYSRLNCSVSRAVERVTPAFETVQRHRCNSRKKGCRQDGQLGASYRGNLLSINRSANTLTSQFSELSFLGYLKASTGIVLTLAIRPLSTQNQASQRQNTHLEDPPHPELNTNPILATYFLFLFFRLRRRMRSRSSSQSNSGYGGSSFRLAP